MQCTIPWSSNKALEWRTFPNLSWKDCFWRAVFTVYLHCLFKLLISPVTTTCLLCMMDLFQRKILSQLVHCCVVAASLPRLCPDPHRQPAVFLWALAFRNAFRRCEPRFAPYRQEASSPATSLAIHHPAGPCPQPGQAPCAVTGCEGTSASPSRASHTQQGAALS